ncbi:hypothetical protein GDO86_019643, partial [Hymenochirus boettgeri]
RLTFHDGHSDPLKWRHLPHSLSPSDFTADRIRTLVGRSGSATVVLDSLSWILARLPLPSVCHTLKDLSWGHKGAACPAIRIVALLHKDLHLPGVFLSVCHLADTLIDVEGKGDRDCVTITHHGRTGRTVTSVSVWESLYR